MLNEYFFNLNDRDVNKEDAWELYKNINPYLENDHIPLGVELHCIYGYGIPTVKK